MARAQRLINRFSVIASKLSFPYTFNPATYGNGPLPYPWQGSTFAISGGNVINTPTLEAELLTDPGLEGAYTAGLCAALTKSGSPTVADNSPDVHGGSHAQQFAAVAINNNLHFANVAGVASRWYLASIWGKRLAGSAVYVAMVIVQTGAMPEAMVADIVSAGWQKLSVCQWSPGTANFSFRAADDNNAASGVTVAVDDASLKKIVSSSLFAMLPPTRPNVTLKVQVNDFADYPLIGMVLRADSQVDPTNYLLAVVTRRARNPTFLTYYLIKSLAGVVTNPLKGSATIVANAFFEVRAVGDQVSLWYNNAQVGATQTISELTTNRYHGLFSGGGGNSLKSFFLREHSDVNDPPYLLLTFDDGYISQYNSAFPVMQAKGFKGTIYAVTNQIGQSGYMTAAQALEMQAAGWSIANHTATHPDFTGWSDEDCNTELAESIADLEAIGSKSAHHLAYPWGISPTLNSIHANNFLSARAVSNTTHDILTVNCLSIPCYTIENTMDVAYVEALIDAAIAANKCISLLFHNILTPDDTTYKWSVEKLTALMDLVAAKDIKVITIEDWWTIRTT